MTRMVMLCDVREFPLWSHSVRSCVREAHREVAGVRMCRMHADRAEMTSNLEQTGRDIDRSRAMYEASLRAKSYSSQKVTKGKKARGRRR